MSVSTADKIFLRVGLIDFGGASAEDLKNCPTDLKRKLIILHRTGWGLLLVMCGLAAVAKSGLV